MALTARYIIYFEESNSNCRFTVDLSVGRFDQAVNGITLFLFLLADIKNIDDECSLTY